MESELVPPHNHWDKYYKIREAMEPNPQLDQAVAYVEEKKEACDLGAGTLVDAKHLLALGFEHITTIDNSDAYKRRVHEEHDPRIDMLVDDLDLFELPSNHYDLVSAQRSLHYTSGGTFSGGVFKNIAGILKPKGILTATIKSNQHELASRDTDNKFFYPSRVDLEKYLIESGFEPIKLEESTDAETDINGQPIQGHNFRVIARKIAD